MRRRDLVCASALPLLAQQAGLEKLAAHPRLLASNQDISRIRRLTRTNPEARDVYSKLAAEAEAILKQPPVEYKLIGPRLLDKSRTALGRIYTLGLLYRLEGDRPLLTRITEELRAAAAFPDWNPSHFLDTAEMTHAFAIAYDWLYHVWSEEERGWIRAAIVTKGLDPALAVYESGRGWPRAVHNWNQVCNGGITLGALAVAENEPERAARILRYAVASIPTAMASYAPDGGWNEGPGYWDYATRYNVAFLAALESALGHDYGLSQLPGFSQCGEFRVYFSSPAGRTFNYADAGDGLGPAACTLWLARRFQNPVCACQELELLKTGKRAHSQDLLWWPDKTQSPAEANWPLDKYYAGVQTAFLRGSWSDLNTMWIGAKGGDNKANHSHLDLGTFVLDAQGERWALDLGPDDYNLPAYFGDKRWTYYRLRTESHNVVLIDNENQDPKAVAKLVSKEFTPASAQVTHDLTAAYPGKLARHHRTIELRDRRRFAVRDEIEAVQPVEALWGMVTDATVTCDGRGATLEKYGKRMVARILAPANVKFDAVSAQPPAPQRQNAGVSKLVVRLPEKVRQVKIEVEITTGA